MEKVNKEFVQQSFTKGIVNYREATEKIGLWKSEEYIFDKYFEQDKRILDVGCGTGRTTFGLYERGYTNLVGVDLTSEMIKTARKIKESRGIDIDFREGDATDLEFAANSFDYALFAFNGLMQIPKCENRIKAMAEIKRVLKPGGVFIFTTHDREVNDDFKEFWEQEEKRWEQGEQDDRLHEYGDRIIESENEERDVFLHFPDREEVLVCLKEAGLSHVEDFYREDEIEESEGVKEFSSECRFWVAKK